MKSISSKISRSDLRAGICPNQRSRWTQQDSSTRFSLRSSVARNDPRINVFLRVHIDVDVFERGRRVEFRSTDPCLRQHSSPPRRRRRTTGYAGWRTGTMPPRTSRSVRDFPSPWWCAFRSFWASPARRRHASSVGPGARTPATEIRTRSSACPKRSGPYATPASWPWPPKRCSLEDAAAWMQEPNRALDDDTPMDMAETDPGATMGRDLLLGVQHGFVL